MHPKTVRFIKDQRLHGKHDFAVFRKNPWLFYCSIFALKAKQNPNPEAKARIGLIASRRVGNAIARNKAKRLAREIFRLNQALLPKGADLLMVLRPHMLDSSFLDIQEKYREACRRLNKLK